MGFDLFILAILLVTTIRGAAKGVAWQLAGIAALILCFMFATPLSLTIAPMIKLDPPLNRWVAMLGIYLVFSFGTFAVARGFREALEKAKFVEFDRHLGALFGLFKGAIIALVITFFCVAMSRQARDVILKTYTGYASAHIMNAIDPVMPKELHAILEPYIHQLDAVDPELAVEREQRDQEVFNEEGPPAPGGVIPRTTSRGYRPTGRNPQQLESEGPRAVPRDPFQDGESELGAPRAGAAANPPQLNDPEQEPEVVPATDSAFGWLNDLPHLAAKITPAIKKKLFQAFQNTAVEHRDEFINTLKKTSPSAVPQVAQAWINGRPAAQATEDPFESPAPPKAMRRPQPPIQMENEPEPDTEPVPPPRPLKNSANRIRQPVPDTNDFNQGQENGPFQARTNRQPVPTPMNQNPQRHQLLLGIAKVFSSRKVEQAQKMTEIETLFLGLPDPVVVGVLEDWLSDLRGADPDPDPQTDLATTLNVRIARQVDALNIPHDQLDPQWQTKLERFYKN
ncbi:MAG: Colicin production protein [Planctomycetaceae bacterium]|nr:Colicin production protein [Planctomycetaceae bacterium]